MTIESIEVEPYEGPCFHLVQQPIANPKLFSARCLECGALKICKG